MALVTRLSRLFQADFHAVLDRIEEPDLQLRQAVREMQFALDQDRQRLDLLRHEITQLQQGAIDIRQSLEHFDEELDICLAAQKDDLARDLIRRKLAGEKQLRFVEQQGARLQGQADRLDKQVEEQAQQLTAMQQKLELLAGSDSGAPATGEAHTDAVRAEEIEIALLREKERRTQR